MRLLYNFYQSKQGTFLVYMGKEEWQASIKGNARKWYPIVEFHVHPDYDPSYVWNTYIHDIALIKLRKPIKISPIPMFGEQNNICLPQKTPLKDGMKEYAMSSGWGGGPAVLQIGYWRLTYESDVFRSMSYIHKGQLTNEVLKLTAFMRKLDNQKICLVRTNVSE